MPVWISMRKKSLSSHRTGCFRSICRSLTGSLTNVDLDTSAASIPTTANIRRESAGTWTGLCGRGAGGNAKGKSRARPAYLITVIMRACMLTVVIRRVIGRRCITARVELPISSRPLIIGCYAKIHTTKRERGGGGGTKRTSCSSNLIA